MAKQAFLRILSFIVGSILIAAPIGAQAGGPCAPLPTGPLAGLFGQDTSCDVNADLRISAADVIGAVRAVTRPACPAAASLAIFVENRTDHPAVQVRLRGVRRGNDCINAASTDVGYDWSTECGSSDSPCLELTDVAPGHWVHTIEVEQPNTGQIQHQPSLVISGDDPNAIRFTAFASALRVSSTGNTGGGSLRNRLQATGAAPKPVLVWFDHEVFLPGVRSSIALDTQLPALTAGDVTIDGTDAGGEYGNRVIDARGRAFGALSITSARNRIIGLRLRGAGQNDRDVVNISGDNAVANRIEHSVIETAASADGLGVDQGAGDGFDASTNVLYRSEVRDAVDKGVKVTTGAFLRIEESWIHHNVNGGVQATLAGNVQVVDSLIEDNRGGPAQNGLSVQAAEPQETAAYLESRGNLVRRNGANGVSVRAAVAVIEDSYFAGNGTSGLRIFNDVGPGAEAVIEGSTAACNEVDGAVVANNSTADFGGGALQSSGDNAFTQNNLPAGGANLRNASGKAVAAADSQWEHCGRDITCDHNAIRNRDLNDEGQNTDVEPAQAHRALVAPQIERIESATGKAGDLMRVFGSGFNVIDGHFAEDACADVAGRNRCLPLRGNCVRIGGVAAAVEAVTPTMLIVRRPYTCLTGANLTVTVDKGSTGLVSNSVPVCEPL